MNDRRRGVYILPNLFTTANMFLGFYAIVHAVNVYIKSSDTYRLCAMAIIGAAICDGLDGRVARRTRTSSRFGLEYDSLADVVSFGVAPAIVLYLWALRGFGRVGWLAAFLYVACGALRLARFNVEATGSEKKYFEGLPIPMAAMMVAGSILIWDGRPITETSLFFAGDVPMFLLGFTYLLAGLKVSVIPYRSFKSLNLTRQLPFLNLVLIVVGLVIWATRPWWILYLFGCGYLLSGPVERYLLPRPVRAYRRVRRKRKVRRALDRIDRMAINGKLEPTVTESEEDEHSSETGDNVHRLPNT